MIQSYKEFRCYFFNKFKTCKINFQNIATESIISTVYQ